MFIPRIGAFAVKSCVVEENFGMKAMKGHVDNPGDIKQTKNWVLCPSPKELKKVGPITDIKPDAADPSNTKYTLFSKEFKEADVQPLLVDKKTCRWDYQNILSDCLTRMDTTTDQCVEAIEACVVHCPIMTIENGKRVNVRAEWNDCQSKDPKTCNKVYTTKYKCDQEKATLLKKDVLAVVTFERFLSCEWFCPSGKNNKVHRPGPFARDGSFRTLVPEAVCEPWDDQVEHVFRTNFCKFMR